MKGPKQFHWIESGDHGFKPLKASGLTVDGVLADVADRGGRLGRRPSLTRRSARAGIAADTAASNAPTPSDHRDTTTRSRAGSIQSSWRPRLPRAHTPVVGRVGEDAAAGVEPPEQAVVGVAGARRERPLDPRVAEDARAVPLAAMEHEPADARVIGRAHPQAAAPVRTAADDGNHASADATVDVLVAVPAPTRRTRRSGPSGGRAAPRRAAAPHDRQREREEVDANVVVRELAAGRAEGGVGRLASLGIAPPRLAPQRAGPLARLLQQVVPGDVAVARRRQRRVARRGPRPARRGRR